MTVQPIATPVAEPLARRLGDELAGSGGVTVPDEDVISCDEVIDCDRLLQCDTVIGE